MATKVVGLDLGTHTVKCCELVAAFRQFELVGFGSEPVDPAAAQPVGTSGVMGVSQEETPMVLRVAQAAQRLLERRGLLGETLMCALPPDASSTLSLDLPFSHPKKIEQVLEFQIDEVIPFDVEDVVYDYQITDKREDGGCTVLVAYTPRDTFAGFLAALEAVGIDPKVVSVGALSYFNLYDHVIDPADVDAPVAVLDIGHTHTELAVFDQGAARAVRQMPMGGRDVTLALKKAFEVAEDQAERGKISEGIIELPIEATTPNYNLEGASRRELIDGACRKAMTPLMRELRRTLAAHEVRTGRPVERIYLTGGGSLLRGLPAWLERSLGVEIAQMNPLDTPFNRLAGGGDQLRPYIAKSLALSLRAFQRAHQSQLNFRKGDFVYTGDFGFLRGRIISMGVAAVLVVVMSCMVIISKKRVLEAEHQALLDQVSAISETVLGVPSEDVNFVQAQLAGEKSLAQLPEVSAFDSLRDLSEGIGIDLKVDVDKFQMNLDTGKLRLEGKTDTHGDVDRVVDALQETRCFKGRVKRDRLVKATNNRSKFVITASSSCI